MSKTLRTAAAGKVPLGEVVSRRGTGVVLRIGGSLRGFAQTGIARCL